MKGHVHALHAEFFYWCWIFQQLLSRQKRVSLTRARSIDTVSNPPNPAFWGRNSIKAVRIFTLRSERLAQIAMSDKIRSLFQATMPRWSIIPPGQAQNCVRLVMTVFRLHFEAEGSNIALRSLIVVCQNPKQLIHASTV
jgi:hypothetical protein